MLELAIVLFVIGLVLMAAEMFVPGGIVGTLGFLSCVAAIVCAFHVNPWVGAGGIVVVAVITPVLIYLALSRASLRATLSRETGAVGTPTDLAGLVGREGTARTQLRPSGMATIDGKRVNVVTRGELISQGSRIKVIEVEGMRVIVKSIGEAAAD